MKLAAMILYAMKVRRDFSVSVIAGRGPGVIFVLTSSLN